MKVLMTSVYVGPDPDEDWEHHEVWGVLNDCGVDEFLANFFDYEEGAPHVLETQALLKDRNRIANQCDQMKRLIPAKAEYYNSERERLLSEIDEKAKKLLGKKVFFKEMETVTP